jgi:cysteine desulfuration protein SufE
MAQTETQQERAEDLIATFEMLGDWEERYGYLMDLGRKLPPMDEAEKIEANRVQGCQSQVWVTPKPQTENGQTIFDFAADSDSAIVKGLIAILRTVYAGETADAIVGFDIEDYLRQLDLEDNLSMNRRNGLMGMITRIKTLALQTSEKHRQ